MAEEPLQQAVETIRKLATAQEYLALSDPELLTRFLRSHDEAAFETLVHRHGPMILGVCRRMLANRADVEDAFQAVFLVLLRKAPAIKRPNLLGNWLYGVAYHTARAARTANQKRRAKEDSVTPKRAEPEAEDLRELTAILDEELARLPETYREVLVLCDLQGASRKEAAGKLNIAEGTLSSRLARARTMLSTRLKRRGVETPLAVTAAGFGSVVESLTVPPALIQTVVHASLAGSIGAGGGASLHAIKLSEAVIKMMFLSKLKILAPLVALALSVCVGVPALGVLGAGSGGHATHVVSAPSEPQEQTAANVKELIQQSTETIALIEDEELRLDLLAKLGWTQYQLGERAEALATGRRALAMAKATTNDSRRVHLLCTVAGLLLETGDKKEGFAAYQLAEDSALSLKDPHERGNALMHFVRSICSNGEFDEALRLAASGVDQQDQLGALFNLSTFAHNVYRRNKSPAALKALFDARDQAKKLGDNGKEVLGNIAGAFAFMGLAREAVQTLDSISKPDLPTANRTNGTRDVVRGLASSGDWQGALKVYDSMRSVKQNYDLLADIAATQIKAGKREEANATIQRLRAVANVPEKRVAQPDPSRAGTREEVARRLFSPPNHPDDILASVGVLEAKLGDFPTALQTTIDLTPSIDKAKALFEIAKLQRKAGDGAEARKTLRKASRSAMAYRPLSQRDRRSPGGQAGTEADIHGRRDYLLQMIAREQASIHDLEGAEESLDEITTERLKGTSVTLELKKEAGDFGSAIAMLPQIKKGAERGKSLETLTKAMTQAGKEEAARALADRQTTPAMKVYALLGILAAKTPADASQE